VKEIEAGTPPSAWRAGWQISANLLRLYGAWLGVCLLGRAGLFVWQWARLSDLSPAARAMAFVHGWRMDTMTLAVLLLPPLMLWTLVPSAARKISGHLIRGWALGVLLLLTFMEVATFPFFAEYDVRPNILFVEYLRYPREVGSMLWKDQKLGLAVALFGLAFVILAFRRLKAFARVGEVLAASGWRRALWFLPWVLVLGLCVRSSFGHRPANISDALYSTNRIANEIAKNTVYSVLDAANRALQDGGMKAEKYGKIPMDEAYARAFRLLKVPADPERPFYRTVPAQAPAQPPKNLVIIVQESMGAQFVEFSGGEKGLTPNIDALAAKGLAFTNLFSNGTRSIRGLSALSAGFLPVVGEGVIKRPKSQSGFFSLASLLKPHNYYCNFIYGGEARFDNMKVWYLGNGFDEVIEQKDFDRPSFVSTWGVSDEDLFVKANARYKSLAAQGKPFASVVFSSSNHSPFELPEGKFEWVEGVEKRSVKNAIKYSDYAVGRFFELAKTEPYFANTVFVIVADHNVRVYGDDFVPVSAFHIPGLIYTPGMTPERHEGLSSQPDVLATALGMLGLDLAYPILGSSIRVPDRNAFVMMQFNDVFGFRRGDEVAVFRPGKAPATFRYEGGRLHPAPTNAELERDGLALIHVTSDLYMRRLYR
jgi:phosphoglycerol transferase MdoB-like AlkP superfamily enzyme